MRPFTKAFDFYCNNKDSLKTYQCRKEIFKNLSFKLKSRSISKKIKLFIILAKNMSKDFGELKL